MLQLEERRLLVVIYVKIQNPAGQYSDGGIRRYNAAESGNSLHCTLSRAEKVKTNPKV
jgi:hypothetical protein